MLHSFGSTSLVLITITVLGSGLCHAIDRNGNQLDDKWEQLHAIGDPQGDFDADGHSNLTEYQFGTDPKNSQSKLSPSITWGV
jgi:hypothetical protein